MMNSEFSPGHAPAPTAWKSVPGFVRFAVWLTSIVTVVWLFALPVLAVVMVASGGIAGLLYGVE